MLRDLAGKTAVVTGAASGIGLGLTHACAAAGMRLGVLDIDPDALEGLRAELAAAGTTVHAAVLDVSDAAAVERAAASCAEALGPINLVCNNAGVGLRGSIMETSRENFEWLYAVNVGGAFNTIKAFVPLLRAHRGPAHMVITASLAGVYEMPERENAVYSSTKMAVFALARYLRAELQPEGIGVSALCPGLVISNARRSGEHRPERFGGPFLRGDAAARVQQGMLPDDVGRLVLRAIADDLFVIGTHPQAHALIAERHAAILAEHDCSEALLEELGLPTNLTPIP